MVSFNVWSGSDYLKNVNDLSSTMTLSSTTEWSSNGDRSIKIVNSNTSYNGLNLSQVSANINETYTAKVTILNPVSTVYLRLIENNSQAYDDIGIPVNNSSYEASISRTITVGGTLNFILIARVPLTCYIDNIRLSR